MANPLSVIILAAGKGKRMNNPNLPKVMNKIDGLPLIAHVLNKLNSLNVNKKIVVVGFNKDSVIDYLNNHYRDVITVEQKEQLGTGHAVAQAKFFFQNEDDDILILCGDVPNLSENTIKRFIDEHKKNNSQISVLSTTTDNPNGYGRILRDASNNFIGIVEEKDANDNQKLITEINGGVYMVNANLLYYALSKISNNNAQGEYYLTDIIEILKNEGVRTFAFNLAGFEELQGVNTIDDLKKAEQYYFKVVGKQNDKVN